MAMIIYKLSNFTCFEIQLLVINFLIVYIRIAANILVYVLCDKPSPNARDIVNIKGIRHVFMTT